MAEQKDVLSLLLARTPESQLTAEQSLTGRHWNSPKKIPHSLWSKNHIHRKTDKMKRQRAIYQMKEKEKTPEKQLNEVEIGNLPEKEFRIIIVKMI